MGKSLKRMQRRKIRTVEEISEPRIRPGETCDSCHKRKPTKKQADGDFLCSLCEKDVKAEQEEKSL